MPDLDALTFGPFRLDLTSERLWREETPVRLTHKAFAVLSYLATQPARLVTKDELFEAVWPDVVVSDSTLTGCIQEVRRALSDRPRQPRFIETAHGRGYRFIAPVSSGLTPEPITAPSSHPLPPSSIYSPPHLVGRQAELAHLAQWYDTARQGQRQIGFIAGEAGIGKTALVETLMAQAATHHDVWLGHGQCVDHYGAGEAYLPLLEALGRLCRGPNGNDLVALLRRQAPSWLAQMPGLLADAERERLQRMTSGATQTRMLRELAEALEMFTAERSLVLILEDLHWSDASTLEWLAYAARRRDPAHLLLLGTYRPVEVMVREHPLRTVISELEQHGLCNHLTLGYLSQEDVAAYVRQRFGAERLPTGLTSVLHQRTNGNPLFLISVLDDLTRQGLIVEGQEGLELSDGLDALSNRVPASLQRLIELAVEQLSLAEQALLEAASVAGSAFAVAVVSAATGQSEDSIEACCAAWSRQGRFVRDSGAETWPNGAVTSCYRLIHALYHDVLYDRVPTGRRMRLHQQIGAYKERAYGDQAATIAAELAAHFEQAQDLRRAIRYRQQAAENVIKRLALAEAISHLFSGLEMLQRLPVTPEQQRLELEMQAALAIALMPIKGYLAPETEHALARIQALRQHLDESPQFASTLMVMRAFHHVRGEYRAALNIGEQLLRLGQEQDDNRILAWGHIGQGATLLILGDLSAAQDHLERVERLPLPRKPRDVVSRYGRDPVINSLTWGAWSTWLLGYPHQALRKSQRAIERAEALGSVHSLTLALSMSTVAHQCRREWRLVRERGESAIALCQEEGLSFFLATAQTRLGWALAIGGQAREGLTQLQQGLAGIRATGGGLNQTYFMTLLAETYAINGEVEAGLRALEDGLKLVQTMGERYYEAELYRLQGELFLRAHDKSLTASSMPEACFHTALDVARRQQAKSLELRAATSLARLWQSQGKRDDARELLSPVYEWFTEGFDTMDLKNAQSLLDECA